ncbi:MAG: DUF839 domain-containing protein [Calothrix sp. MO_192.B10]|nr:DUF839 domain-containing protein [Calothrix sp. MO_192.B10]
MAVSRRKFLTIAGTTAAGIAVLSPLEAFYSRAARGHIAWDSGFGKLEPKLPLNSRELVDTVVGDLSNIPLLELPPRFKYRAFSITGQTMSDGTLVPGDHDGMAAFPGPRGTTILVRNHELSPTEDEFGNTKGVDAPDANKYSPNAIGGTTTLVIGRNRKLIKDFGSLSGTIRNCAGGPTPWNSWVSCEETFETTQGANGEEIRHGYNFDVPATAKIGFADPIPLKEMGRFSHEAVAVDPRTGYVYETEDRGDSCFYRFIPNKYAQLAEGGELFALAVKGKPKLNTTNNPNLTEPDHLAADIPVGASFDVEWVKIEEPDPAEEDKEKGVGVRYEAQSKGAAIFFRGEGCWYGNGLIYFIATQGGPAAVDSDRGRGNGQVWEYNPRREKLRLIVEAPPEGDTLDEPDNITVAPWGDLILCEDGGGEQFVVGVNHKGELYQFARNAILRPDKNGEADNSEFAGACFSPDGRTLFVNSQGVGITYAIWGPWRRILRRRRKFHRFFHSFLYGY